LNSIWWCPIPTEISSSLLFLDHLEILPSDDLATCVASFIAFRPWPVKISVLAGYEFYSALFGIGVRDLPVRPTSILSL
jgi:hypothetical protein